jgi:N-acetyl sugar amidotransferase
MKAMQDKSVTMCSKCIMDDTAPGIQFDDNGVCDYCRVFEHMEAQFPMGEQGDVMLAEIADKIKLAGKGKKYDCIAGTSGGTDSTYTLWYLKKLGLRPLAVHFDNGWDSEIAVSNIQKSTQILDIDLYTYVVNWEEFRDLQLSLLKASVPEVEMPTDIGIRKVLYKVASEYSIKYVISGNAFRAEGLVPHGWGIKDAKYIKAIHKMFGSVSLKTFPNFTLVDYSYYNFVRRVKIVRILNYLDYSKEEAKKIISRDLEWQDYGGHHHESVYTKLFQSYLAPLKFKMDRRKVSLSAAVRLGRITRKQALQDVKQYPYPSELELEDDLQYIGKKFGMGGNEFKELLERPVKRYEDYPNNIRLIRILQSLVDRVRRGKKDMNGGFQGGKIVK